MGDWAPLSALVKMMILSRITFMVVSFSKSSYSLTKLTLGAYPSGALAGIHSKGKLRALLAKKLPPVEVAGCYKC